MRPAPSAVRMIAALAALAATMLIGPSIAAAAPTVDGEFAVSGVGTNNEIALGPDGNMWVTLDAVNDVAKIAPDGTVTEYATAALNGAVGITAGPDGNMWVTKINGVVKFSPADPVGTATSTTINAIGGASAITVGPDGNLWTVSGANVIRIPPANPGGFTFYPVIVGGKGITSGTDGKLWVADFGAPPKVWRINTDGTVDSSFPVSGGPQGIAAGANGQVAYSDPTANPQEIGRITAGGTPLITPINPPKDPFGVALGGDGAYWYAEFSGNDLGRLTADGTYTSVTGFSANSGPRRIAAGPASSHTLWVTLDLANKVARVTGVEPPAADPDPNPPAGEAPKVTIGKQPNKKVEAKSAKAKVKFKFSSPTAGAEFECSLEKRGKGKGGPKRAGNAFKPCTSPAKYKLKPGQGLLLRAGEQRQT